MEDNTVIWQPEINLRWPNATFKEPGPQSGCQIWGYSIRWKRRKISAACVFYIWKGKKKRFLLSSVGLGGALGKFEELPRNASRGYGPVKACLINRSRHKI